jgi:hypothetical protein
MSPVRCSSPSCVPLRSSPFPASSGRRRPTGSFKSPLGTMVDVGGTESGPAAREGCPQRRQSMEASAKATAVSRSIARPRSMLRASDRSESRARNVSHVPGFHFSERLPAVNTPFSHRISAADISDAAAISDLPGLNTRPARAPFPSRRSPGRGLAAGSRYQLSSARKAGPRGCLIFSTPSWRSPWRSSRSSSTSMV